MSDEKTLLDCKGDLCPMPVYKASRILAKLAPGQLLEVQCTDPGSVEDFPAFAKQTKNELVKATSLDGVHVFLIRKGAK